MQQGLKPWPLAAEVCVAPITAPRHYTVCPNFRTGQVKNKQINIASKRMCLDSLKLVAVYWYSVRRGEDGRGCVDSEEEEMHMYEHDGMAGKQQAGEKHTHRGRLVSLRHILPTLAVQH